MSRQGASRRPVSRASKRADGRSRSSTESPRSPSAVRALLCRVQGFFCLNLRSCSRDLAQPADRTSRLPATHTRRTGGLGLRGEAGQSERSGTSPKCIWTELVRRHQAHEPPLRSNSIPPSRAIRRFSPHQHACCNDCDRRSFCHHHDMSPAYAHRLPHRGVGVCLRFRACARGRSSPQQPSLRMTSRTTMTMGGSAPCCQ